MNSLMVVIYDNRWSPIWRFNYLSWDCNFHEENKSKHIQAHRLANSYLCMSVQRALVRPPPHPRIPTFVVPVPGFFKYPWHPVVCLSLFSSQGNTDLVHLLPSPGVLHPCTIMNLYGKVACLCSHSSESRLPPRTPSLSLIRSDWNLSLIHQVN